MSKAVTPAGRKPAPKAVAPAAKPIRAPDPKKLPAARRAQKAAAASAAAVRGALIAALDEQFLRGDLGVALCQGAEPTGPAKALLAALRDCPTEAAGWRALRAYMLVEVFQAMMHGLFPEEFGEPADGPGICPPAGPRRVGRKRLAAFVAKVCRVRLGDGRGLGVKVNGWAADGDRY